MYNKLFTKILDSSIWLEPTPTRIVWMTLLAAMDEVGFAQFASVANLAHRARVSIEEAQAAATCLESPDEHSSNPANEGRRLEKVPGGWMVLNAGVHRDLVTRTIARKQTRIRVARHRQNKKVGGNGDVTVCNEKLTPSEAETDTKKKPSASSRKPEVSERGLKFADWFKTLIPDSIRLGREWRSAWAKCYDDLIRLDSRTPEQIRDVCTWARNDSFWQSNFQSPTKLREKKHGVMYFDLFSEKMNAPKAGENARPARKEYAGF